MSPVDRLDETSRSLGRIEQQLETITERGAARDAKLEQVIEKQHKTSNVVQNVSSQVTGAQRSIDEVKVDLVDVKARMAALEAPMKRAMARSQKRRYFWAKVVTWAVTVSGVIWFVIQPLLKVVGEYVAAGAARYFNIGTPH